MVSKPKIQELKSQFESSMDNKQFYMVIFLLNFKYFLKKVEQEKQVKFLKRLKRNEDEKKKHNQRNFEQNELMDDEEQENIKRFEKELERKSQFLNRLQKLKNYEAPNLKILRFTNK